MAVYMYTMIRFLIVLFSLFSISAVFMPHYPSSHNDYPQDYFRSPVDHDIKLSGTFGELRPNHFHAGIDIKSKTGKIGQNLYAVADGVVSRINIKSSGYGNAIYIDHPNGYTSVYAHLDKFPKEIADYMFQQQYEKQISEIESYPSADRFHFKKGDIIGTLGLSGRSYGPHLHFEIRDTESEVPINPLLFGFEINDKVRPDLRAIKLYGLDGQLKELESKQFTLRQVGSSYTPRKDTIEMNTYDVGIAMKAYDQMTGVSNLNGIYALEMYVDDSLHFSFTMDKISFDQTRYINAHMDYIERETKKSYFNRCFKLPGNELSIYENENWDGVIKINEDKAKKIHYVVTDLHQNKSESTFWVKKSNSAEDFDGKPYQYLLYYNQDNEISRKDINFFMPKGALYRDLEFQFLTSEESSHNIHSHVYHLHDPMTPLHKNFSLAIQPKTDLRALRGKAFIGYCGTDNQYFNCGGTWEGNMLTTKTSLLGDYCIMIDTIPPSITPVKFRSKLNGYTSIRFKIEDNVKVGKGGEGLSYKGYIDDQWILMTYNGKNETVTYKVDDRLQAGQHTFKLIVRDALGNSTTYQKPISL
jgi:hypothetical protein